MNTTLLTCQETAEVEWRARLGLFRSVCGVPSGVNFVLSVPFGVIFVCGCVRALGAFFCVVCLRAFSVWRAFGRFKSFEES